MSEDSRTPVIQTDLGEQWDNMFEDEQLSISRLCNFSCSLHALVHMADICAKTFVELDKYMFNDPPIYDSSFRKITETGNVRLVRTCICKVGMTEVVSLAVLLHIQKIF